MTGKILALYTRRRRERLTSNGDGVGVLLSGNRRAIAVSERKGFLVIDRRAALGSVVLGMARASRATLRAGKKQVARSRIEVD